MVKNTHGGSKHKSQARKNSVVSNNLVVQPNGPDECFAHVTKMFGNGMCQVETHCDKNFLSLSHSRRFMTKIKNTILSLLILLLLLVFALGKLISKMRLDFYF